MANPDRIKQLKALQVSVEVHRAVKSLAARMGVTLDEAVRRLVIAAGHEDPKPAQAQEATP